MNLLLDSHVLLWSCHAPEKLDKTARAAIENGSNMVFFSSASIWEIAIKSAKGMLKVEDSFLEDIQDFRFVELPIRSQHAWTLRSLPMIHSDPFDRILLAQAKSEQLILVTRDDIMKEYGIPLMKA